MGEVYLVTDTKLNRKDALKFLPPELALNRKHLNRFPQEARWAATLNHPDICTVYEIQEGERPLQICEPWAYCYTKWRPESGLLKA